MKVKEDELNFFRKLRDASDGIVKAGESGDEEALETAMGKFLILMLQADGLKA